MCRDIALTRKILVCMQRARNVQHLAENALCEYKRVRKTSHIQCCNARCNKRNARKNTTRTEKKKKPAETSDRTSRQHTTHEIVFFLLYMLDVDHPRKWDFSASRFIRPPTFHASSTSTLQTCSLHSFVKEVEEKLNAFNFRAPAFWSFNIFKRIFENQQQSANQTGRIFWNVHCM